MLMMLKDVLAALRMLGYHQEAAAIEKMPNTLAWIIAMRIRVQGSARAVTAADILHNWDTYYHTTMPKLRAIRRLLREKADKSHEQGFVSARDRRALEWAMEQLDITEAEVREMFRCAMTLEANVIITEDGFDTPMAYYDDGDFTWLLSAQSSRYMETQR